MSGRKKPVCTHYSILLFYVSNHDSVAKYDASSPSASDFTQMIWKSTTEVGCAVAECSDIFSPSFGVARYYVCEYFPAGNVVGQFKYVALVYDYMFIS